MHADMTAVTVESNKSVSKDVKDNEVLLDHRPEKNKLLWVLGSSI